MEESSERWLPVPEYHGLYEVSDLGRVRSLDRWAHFISRWGTPARRFFPGQTLSELRVTGNYPAVNLCKNGNQRTWPVHALVLSAFIGPRPVDMVACHGPAGSTDSSLGNLRYDTQNENLHDCVRDGNHRKVNQELCNRMHALSAPNLEPSSAKRTGHRRCYACALTATWARYRGYSVTDPRWVHESDRRYIEILHFGKPLNYKRDPAARTYGEARWRPQGG